MGLPGSGAITIKYNTRERLVSTDPNRAQSKHAQAIAEVLRFIFDATNEQDISAGGVETMGDGTESFLRGTILNGIRPRPELGTVNLFITPGVALLIDNASPQTDDSVAAVVQDPGVAAAGVLTLTPGSGSTRIDVLECQRVTNIFESDNRDVFNVSTGLFTPTQVTKVQGGQLAYRIRTGTPGAGFPGTAAGWLPLMVASVPSTAVTWDDCVCWDVRPLASDRTNGPFQTSRQWGPLSRALVGCDSTTNVNQVRLTGELDVSFNGYKGGGTIRKTSLTPWIDITDTDNQANGFGGFGTNTGTLWYLYLVFPFGLPRWARYTEAASLKRQPGVQRGIPAVSTQPCRWDGLPRSNSVSTAASTGLADPASQNAICVAAGRGPKQGTTVPFGMHADGKVHTYVNQDVYTLTPGVLNSTNAIWTLTDDIHMPGNARALYVRMHGEFQFPSPAAGAQGLGYIGGQVSITDTLANTGSVGEVGLEGQLHTAVDSDPSGVGTTPGVLFKREFTVRLPLQPTFVTSNNARSFKVKWTYSPVGITPSNTTLQILGWELGP